jgi:8-oxo-dGTP pyrophosphatase MutT (NUDIX family)
MTPDSIREGLTRNPPREEDREGAHEAGVALLLAPGPELLLIRRAENPKDPWSGQIGLPGGSHEAEDDDLLATAVRETKEEVGITVAPEALLGRLDDFRPRRKTLPDVLIRPFVFAMDRKPRTRCSEEVQYCLWTPVTDLARSRRERRIELPDDERAVETYLAGEGEIVWGITYRILSGFFAALDLR